MVGGWELTQGEGQGRSRQVDRTQEDWEGAAAALESWGLQPAVLAECHSGTPSPRVKGSASHQLYLPTGGGVRAF